MNTSMTGRRLRGIILLLVATLATGAITARAESSFGIKAGYMTRNNSALAGLVFRQTLGKHLRLAPQIGVVMRNSDRDALIADADVHFPFATAPDSASIPLWVWRSIRGTATKPKYWIFQTKTQAATKT